MLYLQAYTIKLEKKTVQLLAKVVLAVAACVATVVGTNWVIQNIDQVLSFRTFVMFFVVNTMVWMALFTKLGLESLKARFEKRPVVQWADPIF